MKSRYTILVFILLSLLIASCSKKNHPDKVLASATKEKKAKVKKPAAPKVITVNDEVALKAPDGRLYYEFQGHRYWKNYDDGRYYLFNKSMYSNKAFKPH